MKEYEDWEIKPWTRNFRVGKVLAGRWSGPISYRYAIFVGKWVDDWWARFWRKLDEE
jgi:hypothetical protein